MVGAALTVGTLIIGSLLTAPLPAQQSWVIRGALVAAAIIVFTFYLRWQARSQEESPEAIRERVSQLEPELRKQVQARSYGSRRNLIEAPLRELELDITPRLGWVRDPRLVEPEPLSENEADDIVAAFESSKGRLLIVGEPGSGKTMAAYSLIEYLDNTEGDGRTPLLVNLSAWEVQEDFETFLVDYLCSSVGYEVHERAVARAFIDTDGYSLILDGLDEIPLRLRQDFSERLDEFVQGLPGEVGVVVTCRTQEYEEILAAHPTGLGLVQAVEILPLSSEQLDSAFVELAKLEKDWETFQTQRHLRAYQRVRDLLSNPLFLNLAVVGHLSPEQLLDWTTTEQELRDLVLDSYLDRTLADQKHYGREVARRYLSWIACFLNGDEVSPFGLKTSDFAVFDLADLTPPDPPRRYRLIGGLAVGMVLALVLALVGGRSLEIIGLTIGLVFGLIFVLFGGLTREVGEGLIRGLVKEGLVLGAFFGLLLGPFAGLSELFTGRDWVLFLALSGLFTGLVLGLGFGMVLALGFGLVFALGFGLLQPRSVLITSRTPKEARSRSLIAALTWLLSGLLSGLLFELGFVGLVLARGNSRLVVGPGPDWLLALISGLIIFVVPGLFAGLVLGLRNGGWFVLLQKVAHRRLARAGNLPSRLYDFLEWGVGTQLFRRVGGGVRFRHNLIQQHLANASERAA